MPNKREMRSLVNYGEPINTTWLFDQGFTNVLHARYWTSTSFTALYPDRAFAVNLPYGYTSDYEQYKDEFHEYSWPVRGGHGIYSAPADLPQTGQTTNYSAGDDGALRKGAPWPYPRFSNHGNGTITDNLTGLMWTQDGQPSILSACTPSATMTWQDALAHVACLNTHSHLGYTNWRVPNVIELESVVNSEYGSTTDWLGLQFNRPECRKDSKGVI